MIDTNLLSIVYHDLFDFPLTEGELIKWEAKLSQKSKIKSQKYEYKNGYYFLKGREALVSKRVIRKRVAKRKMAIAQKAARILRLIPTIKLVGITGALAMENARNESDIDFLLITSQNSLWLSRLVAFVMLKLTGFKLRHYGDKNEKDKLCLNMWVEKTSLVWPKKDRNIYSAHEIGQLVPLINKNNMYEYFIGKNNWLKGYWPNAIKVDSAKHIVHRQNAPVKFLNEIAYQMQRKYMQGKITRETVTKSRAIFHPINWSVRVKEKLAVALGG